MNVTIGIAAATLLATTVSVGLSPGTRGTGEPAVSNRVAPAGASELELAEPGFLAADTGRDLAQRERQREEKRHDTQEAREDLWSTELAHELVLPASVESLAVNTGSGDVEVHASRSGRLEVQAKVRARREKVSAAELTQVFEDHVEIVEEDGVLKIEDAHREQRGWSVSFVVHVPGRLPIAANSGSGNVTIRSAQSAVKANTGSGDVRVDLASERVETLAANTGSGDVVVQVASVEGKLSANTGSGDVTVLVVDPSSPGEARLNTGSGDVSLVVPANVVGTFDLATHGADIEVPPSLGIEVRREDGGRRARGSLGSGGGSYELRSGSGDLRIRLGTSLPVAR